MDLKWDTAGLVSCTIDLTEMCNLRCTYCFTWGKTRRRLSEKMGKKIIDFFFDHLEPGIPQPYSINWWGGEPLLEWDLLKKLTHYAEQEFYNRKIGGDLIFGGTTNGLLLDVEKLKFLRDHHSLMMVSWDGVKEVHDKQRVYPDGRGSFDDWAKGITTITQYWPEVKIRFSVSIATIDHIVESVRWLYNQGVRHIAFSPVYEDPWTDEDIKRLKDQLDILVDFMNAHPNVTCKHISDAGSGIVQDYPCGAGRGYVGFAVDGKIFPCHRFHKYGQEEYSEKWRIGDIETGFNEKRQIFLDYPKLRKLQCGSCPVYDLCAGGCYAVHTDLAGNPFQQIPAVCKHAKMMQEVGKNYKHRKNIGW